MKNKGFAVQFQLMDQCNYRCRHCIYECGPGKPVMDYRKITKVLRHIPKKTVVLSLTGGEVYTERDLLYKVLDYIGRKEVLPNTKIVVETNCSWVKDEEQTLEELEKLMNLGVHFLTWSGNDIYHEEQGLDCEMVRNTLSASITELYQKIGFSAAFFGGFTFAGPGMSEDQKTIFIKFQGSRPGHITAHGRALDILPIEWARRYPCDVISKNYTRVIIDSSGLVHACGLKVAPSLGSAIDHKVEKLVEKAKKRKFFEERVKGPRECPTIKKRIDEFLSMSGF